MAKRSKKKSKLKRKIKAKVKVIKLETNKDFKHLSLIKQNRLSVMPIDSKSWKILNKMSNIR